MVKSVLEHALSCFVVETKFDDIPPEAISNAKNVILTNMGTIIAGANVSGIEPLVREVKRWGGKKEATVLMYGGKVPTYNAGFINSVMARALDFDDAGVPGIHIGASAFPTALAVAEEIGGCSGKDLLTALILGSEVSQQLNLEEHQYNGFDPSGICSVFATSAVAGRLLGLTTQQMSHALALAFARCGGSFQSNVSGSLAVRLTQGFSSQNGIMCAHLARIGMTGPAEFLTGVYGYYHLYGQDKSDIPAILDGLGKRYKYVYNTVFKKYPSCGATQASTDAILNLVKTYNLLPEDVLSIDIHVTPGTYRLAGKHFEIRDNPKVDAQFNIQYCVADALLRRSSKLDHFDEAAIREPKIIDIVKKTNVISNPTFDAVGHTAMAMLVKTRAGKTLRKNVGIASGFPGNPLAREDHLIRFHDCVDYARSYYYRKNDNKISALVDKLEDVEDVRAIVRLLRSKKLADTNLR